jgi:CubicO group peptidase (beta-lactamase class C family)
VKKPYSALASWSILAEVVRRLDGGKRRFFQIMQEELFRPLGMKDSSLGQRPDLESRRVPIVTRDKHESRWGDPDQFVPFNTLLREGAEVPSAGVYSTAYDTYRFAEMLRQGGQLDGVQLDGQIWILLVDDFTREGLPRAHRRPHQRRQTTRCT